MSEERYSRRRFLLLASATGTLAVLGIGLAAKRESERTLAAELGDVLVHSAGARAVGAAWLGANPDQRPADLTSELFAALGPRARYARGPELHRLIAQQVHGDYAAGRVEQVKGWVLSRTEVRLSALAAVSGAEPWASS
jgi:hypothetical protein